MSNNYQAIRIDINGSVAEVVLDNADNLNLMAPSFFGEIRDAFNEIDGNGSINAVVLWAEGRMFTAGLNLKKAGGLLAPGNGESRSQADTNMGIYKTVKDYQDCFSAIQNCRKPVIAAIHNRCIGGGVDLITACDFRVCTTDASFAIYETKIAIVADVGTLQRITPIVGKGMAREMALTGAFIDAERALRCGLVNTVYAGKDEMLEGVRSSAAEIAANSPLAVQGTKTVLNYADEHSTEEGLEQVAQWNSSFLQSNDLMEAVSAFAEKREPKFKGN